MKTIERILWSAAILFLIFLLFRSCNRPEKIGKTTVIKEIKIDTVKGKSKTVYTPKYIIVNRIDTHYVPSYPIDPSDFFTDDGKDIKVRQYTDTLSFGDSCGYAIVQDSIAGFILQRAFEFNIFQKTKTVTIEKEVFPKRKTSFYLGGETFTPIKQLGLKSIYIGAALIYKSRNDNMYKASFGILNSKQQVGFSFFKKIN